MFMNKPRLKGFVPYAIAGIIMAFMVSCGGGDKEGSRKLRVGKGGVVYGHVFRMNEVQNFRDLYPHNLTDVYGHRIANQIYQGLYKIDQANINRLTPCIAESYTQNEEATEFTFTIRRGVYFHDDPCFPDGKGREVTANDFKYCFTELCTFGPRNQLFSVFEGRVKGASEYYASTKSGKPLPGGVEGIEVLDDFTLKITLNYPFSGFRTVLAHNACWVFPKEAVDHYKDEIRINCVGTGPFKVKKVREGEVVILERNDNYWEVDEFGNKLPYLDAVKVSFIKEKKQELMEFDKGNLDMIWKLPIENINDVVGDLKDAQKNEKLPFIVQSTPALSTQYYGFQHKSEIFSDVRVRKAFNYAINREELAIYTLQGEGIPGSYGIVPPSFNDYLADSIKGYQFDPGKARALLAEAGYPDGKGFPALTLYINSGGSINVRVAESVLKMLQENLNIVIEPTVLPSPQHFENVETGQALFFRTAWVADYPDPENFLDILYGKRVPEDMNTRAYINSTRYQSAKFDSIFEMAMQEIDVTKRMELYREADQVAMDDAAIMPLYYDETIRLVKTEIMNFPINGMEFRDLSRVYKKMDEKVESRPEVATE